MGGGISKIYPATLETIHRRNGADFLFSDEPDNTQSKIGHDKNSIQSGYVSENVPEYLEGSLQDEEIFDTTSLFIAMCYMLIEKFKGTKNKKLLDFIDRIKTTNMENPANMPEFSDFKKYCENKSRRRYSGYEIIIRYLTKYSSDSSGVFMKLKKHEWLEYVNRFLKTGKNNAADVAK